MLGLQFAQLFRYLFMFEEDRIPAANKVRFIAIHLD